MLNASHYYWAMVHTLAVCGLAAYGCHRLWLLICWARERRRPDATTARWPVGEKMPGVTIQLPLYNERFVAARILAAAAALHWPPDRLEIQVLDDSTDETGRIVDEESARWRRNGVRMNVLRRDNRRGYKAGALAEGLAVASGEFVAIFDADFMPEPDFLYRTMPYFSAPEVGMVQARWGFLNAAHSWLTRIQALLIGPHFSIEHRVRHGRGLFFNFNGTAGIWRRAAIDSAGGWRADTVTEDLDLSYRAQMAGWRFVYVDNVVVVSEIPVTLSAFRCQQQRWAKGSIQTARKILPALFRASLPLSIKVEAAAHLLANLGWLFGAVATLSLYPTILWRVDMGPYQLLRFDIPFMLVAIGAILLFFFIYAASRRDYASLGWLLLVPVFSIGIAPALALAVLQGAVARGGSFERTPKYGVQGKRKLSGLFALEYHRRPYCYFLMNLCLTAYCLLPVHFACQRGTWPAIPFLMLFPLGFALVALCELKEIG